MTYTILQVVTNSYDKIYECLDKEATQRILYTDAQINSNTWNVRKIPSNKDFPFDDIFKYRWNPFEYTDTDYVIWVDGSIAITDTLKPLLEEVIKSGADFATLKHPKRNNIFEEYKEWCKIRNYNKLTAFKWMSYMEDCGWNPKNPGLYQVNVCIFKNNDKVKEFCKTAINELHTLDKEHFERLDQTVISFLLKTKFKDLKVFELSENIYKHRVPLLEHWNHPKK